MVTVPESSRLHCLTHFEILISWLSAWHLVGTLCYSLVYEPAFLSFWFYCLPKSALNKGLFSEDEPIHVCSMNDEINEWNCQPQLDWEKAPCEVRWVSRFLLLCLDADTPYPACSPLAFVCSSGFTSELNSEAIKILTHLSAGPHLNTHLSVWETMWTHWFPFLILAVTFPTDSGEFQEPLKTDPTLGPVQLRWHTVESDWSLPEPHFCHF